MPLFASLLVVAIRPTNSSVAYRFANFQPPLRQSFLSYISVRRRGWPLIDLIASRSADLQRFEKPRAALTISFSAAAAFRAC
jgi:hypothetical protein